MKFEAQVHRQRFALGVICGLLPLSCLLSGLLGEIRGVNYDGWYESTIDGNVWAPDAYPAGWVII